jgi:hypothetical protein
LWPSLVKVLEVLIHPPLRRHPFPTRPHGDRYLSAIVRLQGFSSCSSAAFPHQWSVWWGEASRAAASDPPSASRILVILAEAEGELSRGLPLRGPVTLFFLQCLGEKGILQPCGGFLQPCGGRQTAAPWTGCSFPSFVRAAVVPRTGWPRLGLPRAVSRARGLPSTSRAARAVFVFWGCLGEDGSEDLSVRFGTADARWCGVGGSSRRRFLCRRYRRR